MLDLIYLLMSRNRKFVALLVIENHLCGKINILNILGRAGHRFLDGRLRGAELFERDQQ